MNTETLKADVACQVCGGTGWERSEGGGMRHCRCLDTGRIERLMADARIPKRYEHCDLDSYIPNDPTQKKAKADTARFIEKYPLIDMGVLFLGPCGVGKTHLAVSILKRVITEKGDSGLFYDFRDLLREIQLSWDSVSQVSEWDILRPVLEARILVLDELGSNKPTDWVRDTMAHIINCRYNDRRVTIFTSNYLDTPMRSGEETLTDRVGIRLRSRLYEMCKLIEIRGKDFRREIKQADYRF